MMLVWCIGYISLGIAAAVGMLTQQTEARLMTVALYLIIAVLALKGATP